MKIPNGYTEQEVLDLINKIVKNLAYKFIFPPYEYEDVVQEGRIIGMEGLEKYSDNYPLENFLRRHIKWRLCTFKRNNYMRLNKPCLNCPFQAYIKKGNICTKYNQKEDCELYKTWVEVTEKKKNINAPISMDYEHYSEQDATNKLSNQEILGVIDKGVSVEIRPLWLQLKNGVKLSRNQMNQIKIEVENILRTNNIDPDLWFKPDGK